MSYIIAINEMEQMYFKSVILQNNSNSDNGVIRSRMESGVPNYLMRWEDVLYDLNLQFITKENVIRIKNEVTLSMNMDGLITLDYKKMEKAGWFDFDLTINDNNETDPEFYVTDKIQISRIVGTDLWEMKIKLSIRREGDFSV